MARSFLALATLLFLGIPATAYVVPGAGAGASVQQRAAAASAPGFLNLEEAKVETQEASVLGWAVASLGVGAAVGWLSARRQQLASAAGAAALAVAPAAGLAIVDYDAVKYLGGTDKVDLNNANVQAYRQFPGMYPTAAGWIATHGPYKQVSDLYEIKGVPENVKALFKKYEAQFV
eukprot:CAMPEP_0115246120 /NCGR_PEP_ID=MMETSP0270-20121206/40858_1 /TAXON_ID=71861 /ORGANISM="Scrippsiella trochoidea, Strain CCMP3099" /LENGTH=175 /DNA_ID=CAMNT_0002661315 /DNA_START=40 /DNA_END=563 /DNA_ORIENTATION=-